MGRHRRESAPGLERERGPRVQVPGGASGSIALISDAVNSLVDVAASIGISYSVEVGRKEPDEDHPFGHQRAEPLAALGVAIFTAILGFSVGRAAVERLIAGATQIRMPVWALSALLVSMLGNLLLARYLRRRGEALDSPAILANAVECENDIGTSFAALVGVAGSALGWAPIDPLAGIVVGAWIVVGGYRFGRQNIDYLMGKSPTPELLEHVRLLLRREGRDHPLYESATAELSELLEADGRGERVAWLDPADLPPR